MRLVTTWFGTFILDDDGQIVEKTLFPRDVEEIAARLRAMDRGEILAEEEELAGGRTLAVREKRLELLGSYDKFEQPVIEPADFGFDLGILSEAMLSKGREKVKASISPDEQVVQAIRTIDDLTKINNLMSERLHEWHGLNFPELTKLASEQNYVELIAEHGDRNSILASGKVKARDSLGAEVSEADAEAMKSLAASIISMTERKAGMEKYVQDRMSEVARNTSHIAGPLIGARLISLTGGMERLARLPSSTIQLLGAEKALFKHLKDNARPPKHGVIFQHPIIHRAPPWQRGKIARAFAAKISIAAKMDYHGEKFIGQELEEALNKKVDEIKKKHPKPPKKKRK